MEIQQLQIGCSNLQMRNSIEQALQQRDNNATDNNTTKSPPIFKNAAYSLLDEGTVRLRALIAVILGSDVFIGGVDKVGPGKLFKKIQQLREKHGDDDDTKIINELINWVSTMKNSVVNKNLLDVYVDSIIFEPANEVNENGDVIFEDNDSKRYSYLYMQPPTLPKYLHDFSFHLPGSETRNLRPKACLPKSLSCRGMEKDTETKLDFSCVFT